MTDAEVFYIPASTRLPPGVPDDPRYRGLARDTPTAPTSDAPSDLEFWEHVWRESPDLRLKDRQLVARVADRFRAMGESVDLIAGAPPATLKIDGFRRIGFDVWRPGLSPLAWGLRSIGSPSSAGLLVNLVARVFAGLMNEYLLFDDWRVAADCAQYVNAISELDPHVFEHARFDVVGVWVQDPQ